MAIDRESFKAGMRHLAGHVCLITTAQPDGTRSGLTATAVCSVSASPPTLLCCVNRRSASYAAIRAAGIFAVNVLSFDDRELAGRFSGGIGGPARFDLGLWGRLETGAPVLDSALVGFDCRLVQAVEAATHGIFFGEIQAARVSTARRRPLLYAHGVYGRFASLDAAEHPELLWEPGPDAEPEA
jgi:flavin reductase (NADH)/flavin reductase